MNLYVAGAGAAVLFGSGVSAAVFTPVIGANAQLARKDETITGLRDKLKASQEAVEARDRAIVERDATIRANAAQEASDASQSASFWKGQNLAAFKAGRAACPAAGGVALSLRDAQEAGAYRSPASRLPGKPESPAGG